MIESRRMLGITLVGALSPWILAQGADVSLDRLRREHPRILATAADFAAIPARAQTNPQVSRWLDAIRADANELLDGRLLRYEKPDGKRLLSVSREAIRRMHALGLMYQLDKDRKYLDRAYRELENVARFADWNPSHFLDTAEMTHAFAVGYDWFHAGWTDDQRRVIREAIVSKGLQPGLRVYRSGKGWPKSVHNWNQVCNGGMTLGALAIADEEPALAQEILEAAVESIPLALAEYFPDGGYKEGPGYWSYGTTYQVLMIAGLESALGTDLGLASQPAFDKTGWFPLHMTGPTGWFFNFADCREGRGRSPSCLAWLGRKFRQPAFLEVAARDASPTPLDVLWAADHPIKAPWDSAPRSAYFRAVEVVAMRGAWNDPDTTYVGFKAGSPRFNHAQMDVGSFVLDAGGERWAIDLGPDDYNLPGYFDTREGRWRFHRNRAEGHNTLVFPSSGEPDQEHDPVSVITKFTDNGERVVAVADLSPSYRDRARKVLRGVALKNGRDVLVQDEIESGDRDLIWNLHTRAEIQLAEDGRSATLRQNGKRLTAVIVGEPEARFTVRQAQPLEHSPRVPGQEDNRGVRVLTIQWPQAGNLRFGVWLTPRETPAPKQLTALSQW